MNSSGSYLKSLVDWYLQFKERQEYYPEKEFSEDDLKESLNSYLDSILNKQNNLKELLV